MNYNLPKTSFAFVVNTLYVGCEVACLRCEDRFRLTTAAATLMCGRETIGYFCANCLTPDACEQLAQVERGKVAR